MDLGTDFLKQEQVTEPGQAASVDSYPVKNEPLDRTDPYEGYNELLDSCPVKNEPLDEDDYSLAEDPYGEEPEQFLCEVKIEETQEESIPASRGMPELMYFETRPAGVDSNDAATIPKGTPSEVPKLSYYNSKPDAEATQNLQAPPSKEAVEDGEPVRIDGRTRIKCLLCRTISKNRYHFKIHMRSHTGEKPFECSQCQKRFITKNSLRIHTQCVHTTERPYSCPICDKTYKDGASLRNHKASHAPEPQYKCPECSTTFKRKRTMREHALIHTGVRPFECSECQKTFRVKQSLTLHYERIHMKKKIPKSTQRYQCPRCPKSFSIPERLKLHIRRHDEDVSHRCPECSKPFYTITELKRHQLIHLNLKFQCPECPSSFSRMWGLQQHIRRHTETSDRHQCPHCPKTYLRISDLQKHTKSHVKKEDETSKSE